MLIVQLAVAVRGAPGVESVTLTVKLKAPAAVGVPVIAPTVGVLNNRPVGNAPEVIVSVYGDVPPEAETDELYGTPTTPLLAGQTTFTGGTGTKPKSIVLSVLLSSAKVTTDGLVLLSLAVVLPVALATVGT